MALPELAHCMISIVLIYTAINVVSAAFVGLCQHTNQ